MTAADPNDRNGRTLAPTPDQPRSRGFLDLAALVIPGIGRVRAQKAPFARAWDAANEVALSSGKPLWVALGDSMTQGIGAPDITGGWVSQLHARLGDDLAVLNLSATGARIADVLTEQLPRLRALPDAPRLVTVLVGANDMLTRSRRRDSVAEFTELLAALDGHNTVIATLPQGNTQARAINALLERAAALRRTHIAEMRGGAMGPLRGSLAEDFFHPNERGYATIATIFDAPVRRSLAKSREG